MRLARKLKSIHMIAGLFVALLLLCFVATINFPLFSAAALSQEELQWKYDFSIETNGYISGITTDIYDVPEINLQLTKAYTSAFTGNNGDIRFFYAFTDTMTNPLEIPEEEWVKLRALTDTLDEGGAVQYDDISGVATIDFSLEQVTSEYIDSNYVFRKFVYFKVSNTAIDLNPDPDIVSYESYITSDWLEVIIDFTPDEIREKYGFTLDTKGYMSGATVFYRTQEFPEFFLQLNRHDNIYYSNISYAIHESYVENPKTSSELSWVNSAVPANGIERDAENFGWTINLNTHILAETTSVFHRYMYFKVMSLGLEPVEEYISSFWLEVIVDKEGSSSAYDIVRVSASYYDGSIEREYPIANAPSQLWVPSGIKIEVETRQEVEARVSYSLVDGDDQYFSYNPVTKTYVATVLGEESNILSYGGRINLKSFNSSMEIATEYAYNGDLRIFVDKVEPVFTVEAKKADGSDYANGDWSATNVRYIITPTSTQLKSGARYQYLDSRGWSDLSESGSSGIFIYEASESMFLSFRAVSGAGLIFSDDDYIVQIDKVNPILNLSARDGSSREIVSMGMPEGPNQRAGYAQDQITFTLSNDAEPGDLRNQIYFEYKTSADPLEPYLSIPSSDSNYVLQHIATSTTPIVNRTYYIRIRTGAGLISEKVFTVTVLRGNFSASMSVRLDENDPRTWLSSNLKVDFVLPAFINIPEEYEIYGYISGDTTSTQKMPYVRSAINEAGFATYTVEIDRDINGTAMSFDIYDKAKNKVSEDNQGKRLTTGVLYLDLKIPSATVRATISGSSIELGPEDWSSGEVLISIDPETNISNVECYKMITETQQSIIPIPKTSSGTFEIIVIETGVYRYRLKSGAGLERDILIPVNIDTSPIEFYGIEADLIDYNGNVIQSNIGILGEQSIANDIRVRFNTNHTGHFEYFYAPFTSLTSPIATGEYVRGPGEEFVINMPVEGGKGEFKYIFYLQSRVQDSQGTVQKTSTNIVVFYYDVRNYSIQVSGVTSSEWVREPINFSLSILGSTQYENDPIVILQYQYRLNNGPNKDVWLDIDEVVDSEGNASFSFGGIKQYFNTKEAIDDEEIMVSPDEASIRKYSSYNGTITFRGINASGHPSTLLDLQVKVDASTPSVVYAVNQTKGEIVWDTENNLYHVYSINQISLQNTNAIALSNPNSIFNQKAPITYYYKITTQSDKVQPNVTAPGWVELTTTTVLEEAGTTTGAYYWIYAKNSVMTNEDVYVYKMHVLRETSVLSAEIIGGTIGASGAYEFNWTSKATVRIRANYDTKVGTALYYWYNIDNQGWILYNATPYPFNVDGELKFFGAADSLFPEAVIKNFKGTVAFKVTNLAGAEYLLSRSVIVKIDVNTPNLGPENIKLSTIGNPSISIEDARTRWYSSAILVEITGNDEIPSGVIYQYKIDGTDDYQFMRTNKISTDDIVATTSNATFSNGNGTITIILQAKSRATQSYRTYELTFNIDKIYPEFKLVGQASTGGVSKGVITSGQWTNAEEVIVSREVVNKTASAVTYKYYDVNTPEMVISWASGVSLTFTLISKIIVVAENSAGLKVEKEFQVNIDSIKPVIHSGIIVNSNDPKVPNVYYIDQVITYTEDNLDYATYNNFPLSNGHIIATNTVDNSNGGYVHIVVADKAGNKAELKFYMTVFPLTVSGEDSSIELNDDHLALLSTFENHYRAAVASNALDSSRSEYFATTISRLNDRVLTLEKQIFDFQQYLGIINQRPTFELVSDYPDMKKYIDYFISLDPLIRYPDWQQNKIREGVYNTYYEKLVAEFAKLNALMEEIRTIEKQSTSLPATNKVQKTDYEKVIRVYSAYLALSNDQKAVFNANLYKKIAELKRLCEVYLLQDTKSGISIYGEKLVGEKVGVSIEVISYENTTEIFNDAQKTLMNTLPTSASRAIISVSKIGLSGYGSSFATGEIVVDLPIPEEFYDYTNFAVYRRDSDGTLFPIEGVSISKDGKSVYFSTDGLDTYVLATTANITVREKADTVYGSIAGIDVDREILLYLAYAGGALFAIMLVVIILMVLRRRKFLRMYDRNHKHNLVKRGIDGIPKGNAPPLSNPARPEERVAVRKDDVRFL